MNLHSTTVKLERMTFAAQQVISRELAADFSSAPDVRIAEYAGREMALRVRQEVYAQHLERSIVTTWATWRDAIKERVYAWLGTGYDPPGHWPWFGDYCRKRWPIQWHETTIDVKALYPKVALPNERHVVTVVRSDEMTDDSRLWFDARGRNLIDLLYHLRSDGYTGRSWAAGRGAYYEIGKTYNGVSGQYLITPPYQGEMTLLGMKIVIDPTVPPDTIELRDDRDRVVGKIYNIG